MREWLCGGNCDHVIAPNYVVYRLVGLPWLPARRTRHVVNREGAWREGPTVNPTAQIYVGPPAIRMGHARHRPKRLAEKLKQIREALGLSQKEMAKRLGNYRTHHHVSKYERGKAEPFLEVVLAYSRVANVTMNQIVDDDVDLPL